MVTIFVGIIIIITPPLFSNLLSYKRRKLNPRIKPNDERQMYGTLIEIAKYESGMLAINFYPIFLLRRLIFVVILVVCSASLRAQFVLLLALSMVVIL